MIRPWFFIAAAVLIFGATCGAMASTPFGWEGVHQSSFPFHKMRPLHVTFSVAWIFFAYLGCLYAFVPKVVGKPWYSTKLIHVHFWMMVGAGGIAFGGYLMGKYSGREYLNFIPAASLIILLSWFVFLYNYFRTVLQKSRPWPAYLWMWSTGVVLFTFTFIEGHLYLIPYFRDNLARDMTVQWKSYGALIGSWNAVVYGLSIYVAEKVSGDKRTGYRTAAYAIFWLSLANLFFAWAHHTYQIPQSVWLKRVAFVMSMTEWAILVYLLWGRSGAKADAGEAPREREAAGLFARSASFWIFANLLLALLISIPWLNTISHGTHVTVAHSMGSTVGINTMILLAAGFLFLAPRGDSKLVKRLRVGVWWVNISLSVFLTFLLVAGAIKGKGMVLHGWSFHAAMEMAKPYLRGFAIAGTVLWMGILFLMVQWLRLVFRKESVDQMVPVRARRPLPWPVYLAVSTVFCLIPWWWIVPALPQIDDDIPASALRGREVFLKQACWRCHGRDSEIPDIFREGVAWSKGWHLAHLYDPRGVRSDSEMPSFRHLSKQDAIDVAAYLVEHQTGHMREASASLHVECGVQPDVDIKRGGQLYLQNCAGCHGEDGEGNGPLARFFEEEAKPRDFRKGRFRRAETTAQDLYLTLTHGMPGAGMPSFNHLSREDRWAIVKFVRDLKTYKFDPDPWTIPDPLPPTPERVSRGKDLVKEAGCMKCHGADLKGLSAVEGGFDWKDGAGRPIPRSTDLTTGVFSTGNDPRSLYRTLFLARGGTPMPSHKESYKENEDRWAMVAYIRSQFSFDAAIEAGDEEMIRAQGERAIPALVRKGRHDLIRELRVVDVPDETLEYECSDRDLCEVVTELGAVLDPSMQDMVRGRTVTVSRKSGTRRDILELLARNSGLQFDDRWGVLLFSAPERLWPGAGFSSPLGSAPGPGLEKLTRTLLTMKFDGRKPEDALREVAKELGLKLELRKPNFLTAGPIRLSVTDVRADHLLSLLVRTYADDIRLENGVLIVEPSGR